MGDCEHGQCEHARTYCDEQVRYQIKLWRENDRESRNRAEKQAVIGLIFLLGLTYLVKGLEGVGFSVVAVGVLFGFGYLISGLSEAWDRRRHVCRCQHPERVLGDPHMCSNCWKPVPSGP
jgi:hypothetical protein